MTREDARRTRERRGKAHVGGAGRATEPGGLVVSLILAMDEGNVIGDRGGLPWRISEDLRRFRRVTMGHPVIMGRKTHEAIGKVLEGRTNIVLTRRPSYRGASGVVVTHSVEEALTAARRAMASQGGEGSLGEVFVIGGAEIYGLFLERADRLYLTRVKGRHRGDTRLPGLELGAWRLVEEIAGAECLFQRYERCERPGGPEAER